MASERIQRRIDILLDEADEAFAQRDWETVKLRAHDTLALDPENKDALTFLSAAGRALGHPAPQATDQPATFTSTTPAAAPAQPTSFANGRYQVKQSLGEGGKKKVYLAHDTLLDREVAFALIKTEGLDEAGRSRIQREAQAMGRLGSHPHIVTVFDLGQEQDQPYMVTELMGGGDVEGLVEKAPDHRLSLEQAINIAAETCRGLEFAHGRGIVHRDLKPGNIWLTQDGTAKIGDFGLAVALDRSRLTTEGMMVGTVSYMPPEQAMGGEVSPRSDLYSLGAMLYEMVTGRPPFLGDDSVSIIGQHINTPPVAPTWHNSGCPRSLDALIIRLLAKDPSERPESASDVLSALDAIDLSDGPPLERGDGGISDSHALDSLAGGVFVGRQREMGELKACLEDALSGRGRLVTLVGEPGIGKTRTAQELATYAGLRGAQVLWGRSYEEQGVPPYWPWVQAIRSYVRDRDPEQLRSEMGAGAVDIAEVVSDVRERLPDLQAAPELEPEQARFRLFDSIAAFLKTASQRQPLVLVLGDLHWADQPSLMLLQFVARELSGARLLIIGTYRDMELSRQHPLAEALGELNRERLFLRVLLRGLTQEDVGRFIEMTSGNSAPRGLVEAVHTQTEGNPLFVTEVVRLLVQEGELGAEQFRETDSWTIRIPEGVREVIGRRLNRLSQRCNEALTVASILGREFALAQLTPLIEEVTEDRLFEVLEEALAARVIEELPQSVGRYQFTHALIQETLSGELSTTRKVRLHARIAQALEELYGDGADAHAAELVHHFSEAEAVLGNEKLVEYGILAGDRALATFAYEEAVGHFQRALSFKEGEPVDAVMASIYAGLGQAQSATVQREQIQDVLSSLERAFDYYVEAGDVARAVAVAACNLPNFIGGLEGAAERVASALELVPPDSQDAGRLLSRYIRLIGATSDGYQSAKDAFERALVIAKREDDIPLEMQALAGFAYVSFFHLQRGDSLDHSLRAIELARQANDLYAEAEARLTAQMCFYDLGMPDESRRQASAALAVAERLHSRFWLSGSLFRSAGTAAVLGDWTDARELGHRGLSVDETDPRALSLFVRLEYETGDFDKGAAYLNRLIGPGSQPSPQSTLLAIASAAQLIPMVYRITGDVFRIDYAEAAAYATLSSRYAPPYIQSMAYMGLGILAAQRSDARMATEQYSVLKLHRNGMGLCFQAVDRILGILAHTMGNLDLAITHFEEAMTMCRKAGYRVELAWTCCDYADTLRERDAEGDRAKAVSLLDESLAISSALGMQPLMERVLSRREILGA
jgi:tetratricopeptide (TPR) repeat protein